MPNGRTDRKRLMRAGAEYLDSLPDKKATPARVIEELIGVSDDSATLLMRSVLNPADPEVQKSLPNGGNLIADSEPVQVAVPGESKPRDMRVHYRKITSDEGVIWQKLGADRNLRLVRGFEKQMLLWKDGILPKHPALASRIVDFKKQLTDGLSGHLAALSSGVTS